MGILDSAKDKGQDMSEDMKDKLKNMTDKDANDTDMGDTKLRRENTESDSGM